MKLNERQRLILMGLLRDQRELSEMDSTDSGIPRGRALGSHRLRIRLAREGLVPMNLAGWIGREPTNSERVLFHREYVRLEGMGLIDRVSRWGGRRTTHIRLTPLGREMAEQVLREQQEELDALLAALGPIELPDEGAPPYGQDDSNDVPA